MPETDPRVIICGGMPRAMSTWQYWIVKELLTKAGRTFQDDMYMTGARLLSVDPDLDNTHLVKIHHWDEVYTDMIRSGRAVALTTVRDIRDVIASMKEFKGVMYDEEQLHTDSIVYAETADLWAGLGSRCLVQRYDELFEANARGIRQIADFLNLPCSADLSERLVDRFSMARMHQENPQHVINGHTGRYRVDLPIRETRIIEEAIGLWLTSSGFSVEQGRILPSFASLNTLKDTCAFASYGVERIDGVDMATILGNLVCVVEPRDEWITPHLIRDGLWEPDVTLAVGRWLEGHPESRVLNVGANVGYFTLLAGACGCVTEAVECQPHLCEMINRSIRLNHFGDWCRVRNAAIWNGRERVQYMPVRERNYGGVGCTTTKIPGGTQVDTVSVDQLTAGWDRVDFILADIEGGELPMWTGMQKTLDRNPQCVVVMEVAAIRYPDQAPDFFQSIADRFPLRHIDQDGSIQDCTIDWLMSRPHHEMLWLESA